MRATLSLWLRQARRPEAWLLFALHALFLIAVVRFFVKYGPANPMKGDYWDRNIYQQVFPQGWGFFTKNPREPENSIYLRQPSGGWKNVTPNNFSWSNYLGLARKTRLCGGEITTLQSQVPESLWVKGDTKMDFDTLPVYPVKNPSKSKCFIGEYVITRDDRLPWAWSKDWDKVRIPSKAARMKISE
jgi:antimicrobial peptide system SdpA family protein